jgi:hypothetical protein
MTPTAQVVTGHEALEHRTFERHYRIGDLADVWKLGRETVRLLVKDEPGVINNDSCPHAKTVRAARRTSDYKRPP